MNTTIKLALAVAMIAPVAAHAQTAGEVRRSQQEVRESREQLRDARRYGTREDRRDARQELREDRQELREDWRDYRRSNPQRFRQGAYVAPRGYRYRPVATGARLNPNFYGSRYVVGDYSRYRLPAPSYGARYVRYGNDLLLVQGRTGRVLRVYRAFYY